MRRVLLVSFLLLVPSASAGFAPSLYFLSPPTDDPLQGALSLEVPEGNESASALVVALPADATSARFIALDSPNGTHVLGRVLVGLWADLAAGQGAVEARFVLVAPDGTVTPVASAVYAVETDPESAPSPEALLPPDPADPEGAVFHAATQVLPLLAHPPVLLDLGLLDVEIPEGVVAGIELRLVENNATGAPAFGFARIQYGAALSPSFVYVPWWSENAAGDGNPPAPGNPPALPGGGSPAGKDDSGGEAPSLEGQDSPGVPLSLLAVGLVALAFVLRRRG